MTEQLVPVRFLNAPIPLMLEANQHQQEIMREFALIQLSDDPAPQDIPSRLLEMAERNRRDFATLSFRRSEELAEAIRNGEPNVDMEIDVPPAAGRAAREMRDILAEADEFCRSGTLLTLATPPAHVAFREWFLGEIVRQLDGEPPTPWRSADPPTDRA
jgi:hypothetical protein